ncbi:7tm 7 domain containing protein [Asbolus verrucosus]|uniref:7tm 7 domain containing protein n=1 Tax=Asbolus verrucosus TaxID=1661398 RepID=A0A482WDY4_ASBVE|nr:7tm 7 domain containing protein [Asbolus verrucosus]
MISMIKMRFAIVNTRINKLVQFFASNKVNTVNAKGELKNRFLVLSKICSLHHHLSNDTFGLILLLMFGTSFVEIVTTSFFISGLLQASQINWLYVIAIIVSCMNFALDVIYVCDVCYKTIKEANKSGKLIHKIETENHDIMDEIEMFSLQIANEKVEFNAAGFFPINYTLVLQFQTGITDSHFQIIGGVTTYVIILIQLSATLVD